MSKVYKKGYIFYARMNDLDTGIHMPVISFKTMRKKPISWKQNGVFSGQISIDNKINLTTWINTDSSSKNDIKRNIKKLDRHYCKIESLKSMLETYQEQLYLHMLDLEQQLSTLNNKGLKK